MCEGVLLELPPGRRQRGAALVAHEEGAAEMLLQRMDARAHRRLGDVEPLGGADEAAGGDDGQESARQFRVHGTFPISAVYIDTFDINGRFSSFVTCVDTPRSEKHTSAFQSLTRIPYT